MKAEKEILIIDPDGNQRKILSYFLRSHGHSVDTGTGLLEALKMISNKDYICMTLDVDIPEMKGYEAISLIKAVDPGIKIIMTANKNSKRLEAKVREQDIFFYYIKSFSKEELMLAIQDSLKN